MTCSRCGVEVPANAAFCPNCGAQLSRAATRTAAPAARVQSAAAQPVTKDVPEEELWSGSYSPKAMTGWYILVILLAIAAIAATYRLDPNSWVATAVAAAIAFGGLLLFAGVKHLSVHYQLTTHRFLI